MSANLLFVVPTEAERTLLSTAFLELGATALSQELKLCGFGPIVSAARTAALIAKHHPSQVVLLGIAGRLSSRLVVGQAYAFTEVICYGVGAGQGTHFVSASQMGFDQWPIQPGVQDCIALRNPSGRSSPAENQLLTACAASADLGEAECKSTAYPNAVAEDMEGFGVAAACRLEETPLTVIRGISNAAGDRDKQNWQIATALHAVAQLTTREFPEVAGS